jgi:predicted amidohydrolase
LTDGIIICLDSTFVEPARSTVVQGATVLFIPTNTGLPPGRAGPEIVAETRNMDITRARENRLSVVRADVTGPASDLLAYGTSGIVDPDGIVLGSARPLEPDLVIADLQQPRRQKQR